MYSVFTFRFSFFLHSNKNTLWRERTVHNEVQIKMEERAANIRTVYNHTHHTILSDNVQLLMPMCVTYMFQFEVVVPFSWDPGWKKKQAALGPSILLNVQSLVFIHIKCDVPSIFRSSSEFTLSSITQARDQLIGKQLQTREPLTSVFFTIVFPVRDCCSVFYFCFICFSSIYLRIICSQVFCCAAFVSRFWKPFTNHLHHPQFTTFQQTIETHSMHARSLEVKNNGNEERENSRELQNSIDSPEEFRNNLIASYRTINWMVSFKMKKHFTIVCGVCVWHKSRTEKENREKPNECEWECVLAMKKCTGHTLHI